jgi:hypothetical protein
MVIDVAVASILWGILSWNFVLSYSLLITNEADYAHSDDVCVGDCFSCACLDRTVI